MNAEPFILIFARIVRLCLRAHVCRFNWARTRAQRKKFHHISSSARPFRLCVCDLMNKIWWLLYVCMCSKNGIAGLGNFKKFAVKILFIGILAPKRREKISAKWYVFVLPSVLCTLWILVYWYRYGTEMCSCGILFLHFQVEAKENKNRCPPLSHTQYPLNCQEQCAVESNLSAEIKVQIVERCKNQSTIGYHATATATDQIVYFEISKMFRPCVCLKSFPKCIQTSFALSLAVSASSFFELHLCLRL